MRQRNTEQRTSQSKAKSVLVSRLSNTSPKHSVLNAFSILSQIIQVARSHRSHSWQNTEKFWPTWRKRFDNKIITQINLKSLKSSSYMYWISNILPGTLKRFPDLGVNLRMWRSVIKYKTTSFHDFRHPKTIPSRGTKHWARCPFQKLKKKKKKNCCLGPTTMDFDLMRDMTWMPVF